MPGESLASLWSNILSWIGNFTSGATPAGAGARLAAPVELKAEVAIEQSPSLVTNPPAGQVYRSYYLFGSFRVGMREFSGSTSVLAYLVTDHLGSTSMTLDTSGIPVSITLYKPWGETRYSSGATSTDYKYTGQLQLNIGIYFYGSRFYDPLIGRFLSADSIIPNSWYPLAFDRYAGMYNNPINFVDPSGHDPCTNGSYNPICPPSNTSEITGNIPDPEYYQCEESGNKNCVSESDDPIAQITQTIEGEGGSLSPQDAANILQTLLNRAYIYWTQGLHDINQRNIPWEFITPDQLAKLILFILSQPYEGKSGGNHPAYNAWESPEAPSIYHDFIETAVIAVLKSPGVRPELSVILVDIYMPSQPIRSNVNVIYFASTTIDGWRPSVPWKWMDEMPGPIWQFFGEHPIQP